MNTRHILVVLQALVALAAFAGGALLVVRTDGSLLHLDVRSMNGVFEDFFYPGVALLGLGALNAVGAWMMAKHMYLDTTMAATAGGTLVLWIAAQVVFMGVYPQQVVTGFIGFVIFSLAMELVHEGHGPGWLPTEAKCAARDW